MAENFQKFSDPKRQSAQPEDNTPPPAKRSVSIPTLSVIGCLVVVLMICLGVSHFVYQTQVLAKQRAQLNELASQRAKITAQNVGLYLARLEDSVAQFAEKPLLLQAVQENNQPQVQQFITTFSQQLGNVVGLRIFERGTAKLDAKSNPPIRFSELEMIGVAERMKPVLPEAAKINDKWLLTIVKPIIAKDGDKVVATVIASLDSSPLSEVLSQNNIGMGEVALVQKFGNEQPQEVIKIASATVAPSVLVPIQDSYWEVRFTPSSRLAAQTASNLTLIAAGLASMSLFLVMLAVWFGRRLGKRIEASRDDNKKGAWGAIRAVATASKDVAFTDPLFQSKDILDVEIAGGDEALLALDENKTSSASGKPSGEIVDESKSDIRISETIFRAYDIRGIYGKDITKDVAYLVGQALGSEAQDVGEDTLIIARDARLHSPQLTEFLIRGVLSTGCHVLNIGTVPTPLLYFAAETLRQSSSGVMVTASHNPSEHNGFKVVMNGQCRSEQDIKAIRSRILSKNIYSGAGEEHRHDIVSEYISTIFSDVALAGDISIVIDAGNAVPGLVAPKLFEELGCQVTAINCELDGNFPNHPPDPTVEAHLKSLIAKVKEVGADLGVALDGDGDRLVVVTPQGKIIWPDRLLMLFAKDVVARNPGADVVFDVKSTRHLNSVITDSGGRPIIWKTGHSPMKIKMQESGALLGGEYSGHIFIKDRWYGFDDGLYAAARLIEILSLQGQTLDEMFAEFPESPATPEIRVAVPEAQKFELVQALIERGEFGDGKKTTLDGLRIDYSNGWGLVRASNTSAHITMRFEADDDNALHAIKSLFVRQLRDIDSSLNVDWDQTG